MNTNATSKTQSEETILPPGEVIHLPGGRRWQIKWELGPNRGTDFVVLEGGVFHFIATPNGWHLRPED